MLAAARRYRRDLCLLFIDLHDFKEINDTLGHEMGDALLIQLATRLTEQARAGDLVARLGGDEFVILLEATLEDAEGVIEFLQPPREY